MPASPLGSQPGARSDPLHPPNPLNPLTPFVADAGPRVSIQETIRHG